MVTVPAPDSTREVADQIVVSVGPYMFQTSPHATSEFARKSFASAKNLQRWSALPSRLEHEPPRGWSCLHHGSPGTEGQLEQQTPIDCGLFTSEDYLRADNQRQKKFEARDIEGKRGDG